MWNAVQTLGRQLCCLGCLHQQGGESSDHRELYNELDQSVVNTNKLKSVSSGSSHTVTTPLGYSYSISRGSPRPTPSISSGSTLVLTTTTSPTLYPYSSVSTFQTHTPLPVLPTIQELLSSPQPLRPQPRPAPPSSPSTFSSTPISTPTMTPQTRSQTSRSQTSSPQTSPISLHARLLTIPPAPQTSSPLFSLLPAEVRSEIFSLALADYPDPSPQKHYRRATCYTRPSYFAPRRTDWALLATCRAVYAEAWHLPFVLREQTHWLTAQDRAPPEYKTGHIYNGGRTQSEILARNLAVIARGLGDEMFEIEGVRVFAQMYKLEDGSLATLLGTRGLRPRRVTLTIRHSDWWFWEDDELLRVEGQKWLQGVCRVLEDSVREVTIELESLERKKDQVDEIAKQMRERWFFKRKDGEGLLADVSGKGDEVTRWSGTSTWNRQRWVRDETAERRLDYYVVAVHFRPKHVVERRGGVVSDAARRNCDEGLFGADRLRLTVPPAMRNTPPGRPLPGRQPGPGGFVRANNGSSTGMRILGALVPAMPMASWPEDSPPQEENEDELG
ncbi:hypothetical protein GE09DRAFT_1073321 [Coniochaeta sp. 2T2.1]|nr:hypothetical protein GE09DRAFT_1073321 [Coniochaeta sp. 2T2.1]